MYIDLTMEISSKTPVFPGDPASKFEQIAEVDKDGWSEKRVTFNSHFSTHIDAPYHMITDGKKLDEYPIETFIGDATKITITESGTINPDHIQNGINTPFLLINTNHSKKAFDSNYYENHPVITEKAAQKIIDLGIKIIGLDTPSPDHEPFEVHKILFKADILIIENLINLDQLPETCHLTIAPLNIKDADGAPCRVIAKVDQ
jgi:arylformamidase